MTTRSEARGLSWGLVGVAAFSLTLPATRAAVAALDPFFVALGRALVAGLIAAAVLAATRSRFPTRAEWRLLVASALGALVARERPSAGFWATGIVGSAVVIAFAMREGGGGLHAADLALLAAVVSAAFGYALGARAAATLGSWQSISWSLVLCLPLLIPTVPFAAPSEFSAIPAASWLGFAYVAIVSQYLGFFAWYRGLSLGGIARVGQLQLLQPFMTIVASALLLGETVGAETIGFAVIVVALVALGTRMRVARA